mmetsp:Transcript_127463/g.231760  ORF Transcript_127463/g.231760 Transcript_127463/m.231760 type:complete len:327 (-) Transcript_127463:96-1076(-)
MAARLFCLVAFADVSQSFGSTQTVQLNNGVLAPVLSLGTAGYDNDTVQKAVVLAYKNGFRAVDTAFNYYNQVGVGRALKEVPRSNVFVISKTTPCVHPQASPPYNITDMKACLVQTRKDIESDLAQLDVEVIDLLLLHGANHFGSGSCDRLACELNIAQWRVYEEFYYLGKLRAIGVSNYCPSCLDCLMNGIPGLKGAKIIPAVNQVKYHPGMTADPEGVMSYCEQHKIIPMSYSPMGSGEVFTDKLLLEIGKAHNKTAAQVALKWVVAKGYLVATLTNNAKHLQEDMDLFSWNLSSAETARIDDYSASHDLPSWACTMATETITV